MQLEGLTVRKANVTDIEIVQKMIKGLALYEKRPQDMTATKEELEYQLFEKKTATVLLLEKESNMTCKTIGYAIYYPIFASFAAVTKVHLEDFYIEQEYRGNGLGKYFFCKIAERVLEEGYKGMEWSCLDWNVSSLGFYNKIGAKMEVGRKYFEYDVEQLKYVKSL